MKNNFQYQPRMLRYVFVFVFCFGLHYVSHSEVIMKEGDKVVYLQSENLKIGLLPDVGGRMVFYGAPEGENLLLSNPELWNEPEENRINPSPEANFKAYNGFITWVGPQSLWWKRQTLNSSRYERGDQWPPDPYLIYGRFNVESISDSSILMVGPESPISGVQLSKTFIISGNELQIIVTAKNFRKEPVAWDIWSNARFDAFSDFSIPLDSSEVIRIKGEETSRRELIPHSINDGFFTLHPSKPSPGKFYGEVKAFLHPNEGKIIVNKDPYRLVIELDQVPIERIHPEQAFVEVYNTVTANGRSDVLELEHHSAYDTITPGGIIEMRESWRLEQIE